MKSIFFCFSMLFSLSVYSQILTVSNPIEFVIEGDCHQPTHVHIGVLETGVSNDSYDLVIEIDNYDIFDLPGFQLNIYAKNTKSKKIYNIEKLQIEERMIPLNIPGIEKGKYEIGFEIILCDKPINKTFEAVFGESGGCPATFTDARDGEVYAVVQIGTQCWMAENLRYNAPGSWLNPDNPSKAYGRLYEWTTVMAGSGSSAANPSGVQGICPSGWHVPSDAEWNEMEMALGMPASGTSGGLRGVSIGKALKSTTGWYYNNNGTNSSGFNALPAGDYDFFRARDYELHKETYAAGGINQTDFVRGVYGAFFWSATEYKSDMAWSRVSVRQDNWGRSNVDKTNGYSCRCIKD